MQYIVKFNPILLIKIQYGWNLSGLEIFLLAKLLSCLQNNLATC